MHYEASDVAIPSRGSLQVWLLARAGAVNLGATA